MKKRKVALSIYIMIFAACLWSATGYFNTTESGRYSRRIETYTYQLKYTDTYAQSYSPYVNLMSEEMLRETADADEEQVAKTVYLTFDDGPSRRTPEILDILKKYDVKATFFIIKGDGEHSEYMKRAASEGHTVAVHTASHKYNEIYKSVDAYLKDFTECYDYITEITGNSPTIFRFPGGSVNNYNASVRRKMVEEMGRRGFVYFDWNVESGDGSGKLSASTIYNNVINGCKGKQRAIVIMHDSRSKKSTVAALEDIIVKLKEDGWQFARLDNEVKPMVFRMK